MTGMSKAPGYSATKDSQIKRLQRVEGQVRGVLRMVEEETYCIDVLTQISAATKALEAVALGLLDEHLSHCVTEAIHTGATKPTLKSKKPQQPSPVSCAPKHRRPGRCGHKTVVNEDVNLIWIQVVTTSHAPVTIKTPITMSSTPEARWIVS